MWCCFSLGFPIDDSSHHPNHAFFGVGKLSDFSQNLSDHFLGFKAIGLSDYCQGKGAKNRWFMYYPFDKVTPFLICLGIINIFSALAPKSGINHRRSVFCFEKTVTISRNLAFYRH
jgi:hypothetical protein